VSIHKSRNIGVFLAQNRDKGLRGINLAETGCMNNTFTNLVEDTWRGLAYRVNDEVCVNNILVNAKFNGNADTQLSAVQPKLIVVK
jgi:hypothetical protein